MIDNGNGTSPKFDFRKSPNSDEIRENNEDRESVEKSETKQTKAISIRDNKSEEEPNNGVTEPLFDFRK